MLPIVIVLATCMAALGDGAIKAEKVRILMEFMNRSERHENAMVAKAMEGKSVCIKGVSFDQ